MSETYTIREELDNGVLQRLADIARAIGLGSFLNALVDRLVRQNAVVQVPSSATDFTWEQLGIAQPRQGFDRIGAVGIPIEATGAIQIADHSTAPGTGLNLNSGSGGLADLEIVGSPFLEIVTISGGVGTITNDPVTGGVPRAILDVHSANATTVTNRGRKTLKIGGSEVEPAVGEVIWDGGTGLRLNASDDTTALEVVLIPSALENSDSASFFRRFLGQQDR